MTNIMIVSDYWSADDELEGKPFSGGTGAVMKAMLAQSGIELKHTHCTYVFNRRSPSSSVKGFCGSKQDAISGYRALDQGQFVLEKYRPELDRLEDEIAQHRPNVIIALGNTALWALCKKVGIKKYRGNALLNHTQEFKVLPTYHPSTIVRNWKDRPIVISDLGKARFESTFPTLVRPSRKIWCNPSLEDIETFFNQYIAPCRNLSCDIETKGETITEVGYAPSPELALVIPFYTRGTVTGNYWPTAAMERAAWDWVRRINNKKGLFGQNFSYDMQYFWRTTGIACPNFVGDTMLQHHAMQPEMEKGLGFLGSIYTNEPSWKFMRTDHSTLKAED